MCVQRKPQGLFTKHSTKVAFAWVARLSCILGATAIGSNARADHSSPKSSPAAPPSSSRDTVGDLPLHSALFVRGPDPTTMTVLACANIPTHEWIAPTSCSLPAHVWLGFEPTRQWTASKERGRSLDPVHAGGSSLRQIQTVLQYLNISESEKFELYGSGWNDESRFLCFCAD